MLRVVIALDSMVEKINSFFKISYKMKNLNIFLKMGLIEKRSGKSGEVLTFSPDELEFNIGIISTYHHMKRLSEINIVKKNEVEKRLSLRKWAFHLEISLFFISRQLLSVTILSSTEGSCSETSLLSHFHYYMISLILSKPKINS